MKLSAYLSASALEVLFAQPFEAAAEPVSTSPRDTLTLAFWSDLAGLPDRSLCSSLGTHSAPVVDASPLRGVAG